MKILVADDEEPCRRLLQDMFLSDPNVQLSMARDGAEAWWQLTEPMKRFDLAILDLRMPHVDGFQLIERLRSSTLHRHLPIILCTGVSDREAVARAGRLAINHYVVKPYKPDRLREKIASFAARH